MVLHSHIYLTNTYLYLYKCSINSTIPLLHLTTTVKLPDPVLKSAASVNKLSVRVCVRACVRVSHLRVRDKFFFTNTVVYMSKKCVLNLKVRDLAFSLPFPFLFQPPGPGGSSTAFIYQRRLAVDLRRRRCKIGTLIEYEET